MSDAPSRIESAPGVDAGLRALFRFCCEDDCAHLARALARRDRAAAIHHSHRLYGSALVMRADALASQAGELERELRLELEWAPAMERLQRLSDSIRAF